MTLRIVFVKYCLWILNENKMPIAFSDEKKNEKLVENKQVIKKKTIDLNKKWINLLVANITKKEKLPKNIVKKNHEKMRNKILKGKRIK